MTIILLNLGSISKSCVAMMSVWDKDSIKFIIFWVLLISSAVVGSSNIQKPAEGLNSNLAKLRR